MIPVLIAAVVAANFGLAAGYWIRKKEETGL